MARASAPPLHDPAGTGVVASSDPGDWKDHPSAPGNLKRPDSVWLRVDEVDQQHRLLHEGLYYILREEETQTWDVGMPLWKGMMRRDGRGTFLMECKLLGHERAGTYTPLQ